MFLHLGNETVVPSDSVIGIFDLDKTSTGQITRDFLAKSEKAMFVTDVSCDLPRSFVLCEDDYGYRVYLSQIAPTTLRRRAGFIGK